MYWFHCPCLPLPFYAPTFATYVGKERERNNVGRKYSYESPKEDVKHNKKTMSGRNPLI